MNPNPVHRLPAALENAIQRVKLAARAATERTIESLGLAALASKDVFYRDSLLGAQFELNRKSAVFALAFNESLDQRVLREVAPRGATTPLETSWDALSLVDDHELEIQVAAERFGLEVLGSCEWELRELDAYMVPVLGPVRNDSERNPLRPEVVGDAMIHAIDKVSERPEVRKVLIAELGRSLGQLLRTTYTEIVADMRQVGIQPVGLTVRHAESRGGAAGGAAGGLGAETTSGRTGLDRQDVDSRFGPSGRHGAPSGFGPSSRSGMPSGYGSGRGTPLGSVDPALMTLIRRLAFTDVGGGDSGGGAWTESLPGGGPLPNLIRAHRDELRQAANGGLDHMVIDVIGSLFDQILADPKVPPQMARQIARLQLPVLRAALGDPSFFSSRRHPVRRFVNRIASLGAAFEDFGDEGAQRVLGKIKELVNDVVEGDFDQIEVYEQKLQALEAFIAEQGKRDAQAQGGAAELISQKEDELRLRVMYAQQLDSELKGLQAPDFVRDFVSHVWSQALLKAAERGGRDGDLVKRLRLVGRELFMSVQPKTSPQQRKQFLADLPKLMKELGEGMDLVAWPDAQRRAFFGQLLPAHAEALKAQPLRQLDFNMLQRRVDDALVKPLPSRDDLKAAPPNVPVLSEAIADPAVAPRFSAEEAERIGLVDESKIDWNGTVDIDLGAEPEVKAADIAIDGLPAPAEPAEPMSGKSLADNVQIGFAYQMHLEGQWQKVRLAHVSAGRTFFVFHHGGKHKKTVSLTHRMLSRLCETGRFRAFENAYLLERATARARRQLAAVSGSAPRG